MHPHLGWPGVPGAFRLLLLVALLVPAVRASAQKPVIREIHKGADYPFLLHVPDTATAGGKLPVIIFLHGRSLSGSNLRRVRR